MHPLRRRDDVLVRARKPDPLLPVPVLHADPLLALRRGVPPPRRGPPPRRAAARDARLRRHPDASQDDVRWARVKATAARWFARLDDGRAPPRGARPARPRRASPDVTWLPEVDPRDVVELSPARRAQALTPALRARRRRRARGTARAPLRAPSRARPSPTPGTGRPARPPSRPARRPRAPGTTTASSRTASRPAAASAAPRGHSPGSTSAAGEHEPRLRRQEQRGQLGRPVRADESEHRPAMPACARGRAPRRAGARSRRGAAPFRRPAVSAERERQRRHGHVVVRDGRPARCRAPPCSRCSVHIRRAATASRTGSGTSSTAAPGSSATASAPPRAPAAKSAAAAPAREGGAGMRPGPLAHQDRTAAGDRLRGAGRAPRYARAMTCAEVALRLRAREAPARKARSPRRAGTARSSSSTSASGKRPDSARRASASSRSQPARRARTKARRRSAAARSRAPSGVACGERLEEALRLVGGGGTPARAARARRRAARRRAREPAARGRAGARGSRRAARTPPRRRARPGAPAEPGEALGRGEPREPA